MNIELLRLIQAHNTAHPEQLDMGLFVCGAKGCIAGHTCLLMNQRPQDGNYQDLGASLLGITEAQSLRLFFDEGWPEPFVDDLFVFKAGTPEYAAVVNARIDHFIATGGAE